MNNLKTIREKLGLSQAALGALIDSTQGAVGHYETGVNNIPSPVAAKIIEIAKKRKLVITYDDIYNVKPTRKKDQNRFF